MAVTRFLLQGLTPHTHLSAIEHVLELPDLERALFSVAFVTRPGVELLSDLLAAAGSRLETYVGIRNAITSIDGLEALLRYRARLYCFDTGSSSLL